MRLGLLLLTGLLSACTLVVEPAGLSLTYRLDFGRAILRFEPDRGPGGVYHLGEEVRFLLTLAEPGWVALFVEDPDGRTYGLDRFYLARGTHVLPPGAYRYTLVPPRGLHRVWAVYTDQAPTALRLEGVYRDFEGVLRLYLEAAQARRHDRAETFFYLR
ncbi:DUF4384 domain-containing protein [Thermus oshimai]|jgi:hypothetical protein|uniref:hypothetical protein n=1 Tax=Thermus oshimai TaxID=56957 RepID=UPI0031FB6C68